MERTRTTLPSALRDDNSTCNSFLHERTINRLPSTEIEGRHEQEEKEKKGREREEGKKWLKVKAKKKRKTKNIQHRVFAGRHRPNY